MKYIFLCFVHVTFLVIGQFLFKFGTKDKTFDSAFTIIKTVFSPLILSGLFLYALTTILWLYILTKMPINRAYPISALAYPAVLLISKFLFNENVTVMRWIGTGIICIGIVMVVQE